MKHDDCCICSVVGLTFLILAAGCSSTPQGQKRSAKTIDTLAKVQTEMQKGIGQVDASLAALENLASNPQGDLAGAYKNYRKQVDTLEAMAKKVASRNQSMRARAKEYFAAWEKDSAQIKSDSIRKVSAARNIAAKASFDKMVAEVAKGKEAFTPLMEELRDIELYLSNDLTTAGVRACKPLAEQAVADGGAVKIALQNVMAELARIKAELTPTPEN